MKLLFNALFLTLCVFMLFTSCCYAYTIDDFIYFCETIKPEATQYNNSIQRILNSEQAIKSSIGANVYKTFIVEANNSGGYTTLMCTNNNITISSNNGQSIGFSSSTRFDTYQIKYTNGVITKSYVNKSSLSINSYYGILETTNNWTNWGNGYFNNKWVEPYTGPVFSSVNNGLINVYAPNGQVENMRRLPFSYSGQKDWTLGYLSNFDDVYQINGYFGPMVYVSGELYTEGYQNTFLYNYYYGTNNNGLYFDKSTGRIYITNDNLLNKQAYSLYLTYNLTNQDIAEDIDEVHYYSYFINLSLSSGDLMSPDLNSTIDIGLIKSLDYFINNSGDIDNINYDLNTMFGIEPFFSGDFLSGDFLDKTGYKDYYNNDYSLFIYSIYRNVLDIFTSNSQIDEYIEFDLHSNHYRIYASQFTVPDGPIKTFDSIFLVTGLIILLVQQFHGIILTINTLDLVGLTRSFDSKHTFFM